LPETDRVPHRVAGRQTCENESEVDHPVADSILQMEVVLLELASGSRCSLNEQSCSGQREKERRLHDNYSLAEWGESRTKAGAESRMGRRRRRKGV
ncbi:hypothetical protein PMAYCL1PPCAC_31924, partial [Pristionchus mayeri]